MAWRGRYLVVGFANGDIPRIPLNLVLLKGCALVGVFWGDYIRRQPLDNARDLQALNAMYLAGDIKPCVSGLYTLEEAGLAIERLANRQVSGKLVVTP
jgi:NADPH2:quinone reductase